MGLVTDKTAPLGASYSYTTPVTGAQTDWTTGTRDTSAQYGEAGKNRTRPWHLHRPKKCLVVLYGVLVHTRTYLITDHEYIKRVGQRKWAAGHGRLERFVRLVASRLVSGPACPSGIGVGKGPVGPAVAKTFSKPSPKAGDDGCGEAPRFIGSAGGSTTYPSCTSMYVLHAAVCVPMGGGPLLIISSSSRWRRNPEPSTLRLAPVFFSRTKGTPARKRLTREGERR